MKERIQVLKVKFHKKVDIEQNDINKLCLSLGYRLPDELVDFFMTYNGAVPETNVFDVSENNQSGVNEFLNISSVVQEIAIIDDDSSKIVPIAHAEGGNYVVVKFGKAEGVYFWDHEERGDTQKLATNINDFLNLLRPFDPSEMKLDDAQVESAWIDPDFLNSLK